MKKNILLVVFCGFLTVAAVAQNYYRTNVKASYYAEQFHGRQTASGEIFNMNDFTAAHNTLPFGTLVRVTNLDTNKSVTVRINDRGPNVPGREIDVSKAAAIELGMLGTGLATVNLEIVQAAGGATTGGSVTSSTPAAADAALWDIQVGAYANRANAEEMAQKLQRAGFTNLVYQAAGAVTRVIIHDVPTESVEATLARLNAAGFSEHLVKRSLTVVSPVAAEQSRGSEVPER